jgi:tRNA1(Val) A37 N6-methylase TrmN6
MAVAADGAPECTHDLFFRGGFAALQPRSGGHRAGSDALLLAAALPTDAKGLLCDLGAGAGVAAFAALTANPRLHATLVEIDANMADLARRSLELPQNTHLRGRAEVLVADATAPAAARRKAGLIDARFDYAIINPPYHPALGRGSPEELRRLARQSAAGGIEPWLRTAAAILRPGGTFALIFRTDRLAELLTAAGRRFGDLALTPLHARADAPAARLILAGRRGSRGPLTVRQGIVLHETDGRPSAIAEALVNGRMRLEEAAGAG